MTASEWLGLAITLALLISAAWLTDYTDPHRKDDNQ